MDASSLSLPMLALNFQMHWSIFISDSKSKGPWPAALVNSLQSKALYQPCVSQNVPVGGPVLAKLVAQNLLAGKDTGALETGEEYCALDVEPPILTI